MSWLMRGGLAGMVVRWASRLRFPYLFALTAGLFLLNVFIPDVIPLADEIIMGLVAVLFGSLKKRGGDGPRPPGNGGDTGRQVAGLESKRRHPERR